LAEGASGADAVIHAALDADATAPHEVDIEAVGSFLRALAGTGKAFVYTSGLTVLGDTGGTMADEDTPPNPIPFSAWRPALEIRSWKRPAARSARLSSALAGSTGAAAEPSGCLSKGPGRTVSPGLSATAGTTGPSCTLTTSPACMCWPSSRLRPAPCCTPSGHQQPGRGYRRRSLPGRRRQGVCPAAAAGEGSPATGPAGRRARTRPACERRAGTAPARLGTGFTVRPRRT
jgi:hypothetical protein